MNSSWETNRRQFIEAAERNSDRFNMVQEELIDANEEMKKDIQELRNELLQTKEENILHYQKQEKLNEQFLSVVETVK
jgi:hypothetical protein